MSVHTTSVDSPGALRRFRKVRGISSFAVMKKLAISFSLSSGPFFHPPSPRPPTRGRSCCLMVELLIYQCPMRDRRWTRTVTLPAQPSVRLRPILFVPLQLQSDPTSAKAEEASASANAISLTRLFRVPLCQPFASLPIDPSFRPCVLHPVLSSLFQFRFFRFNSALTLPVLSVIQSIIQPANQSVAYR